MIDSQHKELIDKINKLLDSCETSKDKVVSVKHWIISQITQNSIWRRRKTAGRDYISGCGKAQRRA